MEEVMALIDCADCGQKVSNLAVACPRCARPIAALQGAAKIDSGDVGVPAPPTPELAQAVVQWRDEIRRAQAPGEAAKRCHRCDVDVSVDPLRRKAGAGYTCGDCYDDERTRAARMQLLVKNVLLVLALLVIATSLVSGAAYAVNRKQPEKQANPFRR